MNNVEKIDELRNALECLIDLYKACVPNACQCDDEDNDQCNFCYALEVLEETE